MADTLSFTAPTVEPVQDHDWHDKVWGQTQCVVRSPYYFKHEMTLKRNTYCSFHYHLRRGNRFYIESGVVRLVWVFGFQIRWTMLHNGQDFVVDSGTPHQFQVLDDGAMFEEYFPDRGGTIQEDDITRLTAGGTSDLVQRNEGLILNADGQYWNGEVPWITLQSSG